MTCPANCCRRAGLACFGYDHLYRVSPNIPALPRPDALLKCRWRRCIAHVRESNSSVTATSAGTSRESHPPRVFEAIGKTGRVPVTRFSRLRGGRACSMGPVWVEGS